jgi:hypothetical protein
MGIVVIDGLGRYEKILSSEAFGPCFRTRLAGAFMMCIWCPYCRLSNKFLIQFLFCIIATCSYHVSCVVCALCMESVFFFLFWKNLESVILWLPEKTNVPHFLGLQQFKCSMASADPASGGGAPTAAKAISR